jgi:hypothetical protein
MLIWVMKVQIEEAYYVTATAGAGGSGVVVAAGGMMLVGVMPSRSASCFSHIVINSS